MVEARKILEPFYVVRQSMFVSEAYTSLDPRAGWLLHQMMAEHDGTNNGWIGMTGPQAERICRCGNKVAIAMLMELRSHGLIIRTHRAQKVAAGAPAQASRFMLTMFPFLHEGVQRAPRADFLGWPVGMEPGAFVEALEASVVFDKPVKAARADHRSYAPVKPETAAPISMDELEGIAF